MYISTGLIMVFNIHYILISDYYIIFAMVLDIYTLGIRTAKFIRSWWPYFSIQAIDLQYRNDERHTHTSKFVCFFFRVKVPFHWHTEGN